jgi:repressor LexA
MLTRVQTKLLDFIVEHMKHSKGVAPSFEQMQVALGLRSKSGVHRIIEGLVERGYIRRLRFRARAIEVLAKPQVPDSAEQLCRELPIIHARLMRVGLYATGQLMHEVVRKSGWELAEILQKEKVAKARRGNG